MLPFESEAVQMSAIAKPSLPLQFDWRAHLRDNWPDAVRLFAAALLAYLLARLLGLREVHWAVLTALITARGHAGGTARAGVERLVATIAGAMLAMLVAYVRHIFDVDSGFLLFAALAPLCLLVAVKPAYRGAPVAALIVLSAHPAAGTGPLATAVLRTGEIALGAFACVLVAAVVFPSRARARARAHAATALRLLAHGLREMFASENAPGARFEALREPIRHELRELTILAQTSGWRKYADPEIARLLRLTYALNGDIAYLARAVARKPLAPVVAALQRPAQTVGESLAAGCEQAAMALVDAVDIDLAALDAAIAQFAEAARADKEAQPASREALIFVLRNVVLDLHRLSMRTAPPVEPAAL